MLNETQNLLERLAVADRQHQKEAGGRFLLRSVKYVCALILAAFVLDVILHLAAGWRLTLLLLMIGAVLGLATAGAYLAFVRRNRLEHIARFLETRDASLGSRLINLLQLQSQTRDAALTPLTRDLARQAIDAYAAELRGTPLERLAWTGVLRRQLLRAAWVGLGFVAVCAFFFRIASTEAARFVDPYGDHPPYSFTRLEIIEPGPAGTNVLYGKGLLIKAKAYGHQPKELFLTRFSPGHPEQAITVPMFDKGSLGYHQLVDDIRGELLVYAHTKDRVSLSKQVRLGIVLTPKLEKAFVQIAPPAYTGLKAEEHPYSFQGVQALEGSEIRFRLQSNRPLREGLLEVAVGEQAPQKVSLSRSSEREVTGSFAARDSGRLRFTLLDEAGLPSQDTFEGALTVTHDLPPEIHISEPDHDTFVALDFKLQAHIEASDDYGLRAVRIHRGLNGVFSPPKVVTYDTLLRNSHESVDFNFAELGIKPGDVISLFAEAIDTAPEAHLARSQTVRFFVISVEDYNNFLREQTDIADVEAKYDDAMADLQDLIENQKKLSESAAKLESRVTNANPKERDDLTRQLDDLLAKQNELNSKLNQQADRLDNFVRDDPVYDVEKDLQELLHQQADTIRQSTRTNDAASRSIAQRSSPSSGSRQLSQDMPADFKKASEDQVERLSGSKQEAQKEIAQTLEDMSRMQELQKDFAQFEALYHAQQELAAQTQAYNRAGQLSREDQLALKEIAATEKQVGDLLEQLGPKLREDAQAAEKLFPKAARSGQDLAKNIDKLRLQPLARQATGEMLAGNGERSFNLADRLRTEMDKLFSDCQSGNCPGGNELDSYLSLIRSMKPGKNFSQMARSRKFGQPSQQGRGQGEGTGEGQTGSSGFATADGTPMSVMGNEHRPGRGNTPSRQNSRFGKGVGPLTANVSRSESDKAEAMKGLNPVNRQSGAVSSETALEEYSDLVDTYFKAITTRKTP